MLGVGCRCPEATGGEARVAAQWASDVVVVLIMGGALDDRLERVLGWGSTSSGKF